MQGSIPHRPALEFSSPQMTDSRHGAPGTPTTTADDAGGGNEPSRVRSRDPTCGSRAVVPIGRERTPAGSRPAAGSRRPLPSLGSRRRPVVRGMRRKAVDRDRRSPSGPQWPGRFRGTSSSSTPCGYPPNAITRCNLVSLCEFRISGGSDPGGRCDAGRHDLRSSSPARPGARRHDARWSGSAQDVNAPGPSDPPVATFREASPSRGTVGSGGSDRRDRVRDRRARRVVRWWVSGSRGIGARRPGSGLERAIRSCCKITTA